MLYPEMDSLTLRTNQSFRECWQPEHHHAERISPFCSLPIDMVHSFPADYMHQCCPGVMKKLLLLWTRAKTEVRLSRAQMALVNSRLGPSELPFPPVLPASQGDWMTLTAERLPSTASFSSTPGKIVLQGVLGEDLFEHFMAFSTAMCILVSPVLAVSHTEYAHDPLRFFVEHGEMLYGRQFLVYNVHSLLHLAADVSHLGCLDNFSAFPFESKLYQIKRTVRSGKNPLVQVANRLEQGYSIGGPRSGSGPRRNQMWTEAKIKILI